MREPIAPSLEELLAEFERVAPTTPGGKTTQEWIAEWGTSKIRGIELIRLALTSGRMRTEVTHRPDIFRPGKRVQVYLHSFVKPPKGRKK